MRTKRFLPVLFFALLAIPAASATPVNAGTSATGVGAVCFTQDIATVATQNSAGTVAGCVFIAAIAHATSMLTVAATVSTPTLSGAGSAITITLTTQAGCTASAGSNVASSVTATAGAISSTRWTLTMSADDCQGYIEEQVKGGTTGVVITDMFFPIAIVAGDVTTKGDVLYRQCNIGVLGAACDSTGTTHISAILILVAVASVGLWVWTRWNDFLVRIFGTSIMILAFVLSLGFIDQWRPIVVFSIIYGLMGGYMLWRASFDQLQRKDLDSGNN